MDQSLIVRFSEITLKGRNRARFERQLVRNVTRHLDGVGAYRVRHGNARLDITGEGDLNPASAVLAGLPGVANLSCVRHVSRELEALTRETLVLTGELLKDSPAPGVNGRGAPGGVVTDGGGLAFRMEVERKDKSYPLRSMDVAAHLGREVLQAYPALRVDLTRPDFTVMVEIWRDEALLFLEKIPGPGGLAVGSSAKALCLMSAGIDSPVAAYRMMTRGCPIVYLHFHSFPFIGQQSKEKVIDMVRFLARFQPSSRLCVAPFAEIQLAIRDRCPEPLRTLLYRRMMNRIANRLAAREGALALVTGESMGQVASQTMENLSVIHETAELPVLQPLIGMSKQEIIDTARRIGTYSISIRPYPDCCTLFQPRHPETHARVERLHKAESALDVDALVDASLAGVETTDYGPEYYPAHW